MAGVGFHFDSRGIGKLLQQGRLQVPPNQRSYAWREKHIRNLFQDLNEAISNGDGTNEYFLGTIVLVQKSAEEPSIVDGQQRLATTTILLARIRDRFLDLNRDNSARSIEDSFLRNINRKTELEDPRIQLNLEDNEFFIKKILPARLDLSSEKSLRPSNRRLLRASKMADELMKDLGKHLPPAAQFNLLNRGVDFLEHKQTVLVVTCLD